MSEAVTGVWTGASTKASCRLTLSAHDDSTGTLAWSGDCPHPPFKGTAWSLSGGWLIISDAHQVETARFKADIPPPLKGITQPDGAPLTLSRP
jgi:hypothetical protein